MTIIASPLPLPLSDPSEYSELELAPTRSMADVFDLHDTKKFLNAVKLSVDDEISDVLLNLDMEFEGDGSDIDSVSGKRVKHYKKGDSDIHYDSYNEYIGDDNDEDVDCLQGTCVTEKQRVLQKYKRDRQNSTEGASTNTSEVRRSTFIFCFPFYFVCLLYCHNSSVIPFTSPFPFLFRFTILFSFPIPLIFNLNSNYIHTYFRSTISFLLFYLCLLLPCFTSLF